MKVAWHFPHHRKAFISSHASSSGTLLGDNFPPELITLKSGLRVVLQKIPHVQSCAVNVHVGVGSITETEEQAGISHLIEHMAFRGTDRRTDKQIYDTASFGGIEFNAATTEEHTRYYVVGHGSFAGTFVDLLLDMVFDPKFDPRKVRKEKKVVSLELEGRRDDIDAHRLDLVTELMFGKHPYGRNVIGTQSSIRTFTPDILSDYHGVTYVPGNVFLSIVGSFDTDAVTKAAESFDEFSVRDFIQEDIPVTENFSGVVVRNRRSKVAHLGFYTLGVSIFNKDKYVIDLIDMALDNPVKSRLQKSIVGKNHLAYSVSSDDDNSRFVGYYGVEVDSIKAELVGKVIDLIRSEFERLKTRGITADELDVLKKQCIAMHDSSDTLDETADALSQFALYHGTVPSNTDYVKGINLTTVDDFRRVANKIFNPKNYAVAIIGPKKRIGKISI